LHFFLQAEDGIRDGHVTGVQTCALPILWRIALAMCVRHASPDRRGSCVVQKTMRKGSAGPCPSVVTSARLGRPVFFRFDSSESKIGRASCRERVWRWVVGGELGRNCRTV